MVLLYSLDPPPSPPPMLAAALHHELLPPHGTDLESRQLHTRLRLAEAECAFARAMLRTDAPPPAASFASAGAPRRTHGGAAPSPPPLGCCFGWSIVFTGVCGVACVAIMSFAYMAANAPPNSTSTLSVSDLAHCVWRDQIRQWNIFGCFKPVFVSSQTAAATPPPSNTCSGVLVKLLFQRHSDANGALGYGGATAMAREVVSLLADEGCTSGAASKAHTCFAHSTPGAYLQTARAAARFVSCLVAEEPLECQRLVCG